MSLYDLGRCWGDFFGGQVEIAHNRTLLLFSFKRWLCAGIVGTEDTGIPEHLLNPQSKLHWEHVLSANPMSKILAGLDSLVSFEYLFFGGVCENVWAPFQIYVAFSYWNLWAM